MVKKLLIIAYESPPLNIGGSHRVYRLVNILKQEKFPASVFTIKPELYEAGKGIIDTTVPMEPTLQVNIIRTEIKPSEDLKKKIASQYYFNVLDTTASRWKKQLKEAFKVEFQSSEGAVLFCTVPPFSLAVLATKLSRFYSVPLVLDFRDAWSQWNIAPFATRLHYELVKRLERRCIMASSSVIVTSPQTKSDLLVVHPKVDPEKIQVITNCYDADVQAFKNVLLSDNKIIKIGYVGSFYYNPRTQELITRKWWQKRPYQYFQYVPKKEDWLYRSPYFFFKALRALFIARPDLAKRIEIHFAGNNTGWLSEMVDYFSLNSQYRYLGMLSKSDSLDFQRYCDALLITSSKVIHGRDYSIAGKTFEYMTMGRPIIAFTPDGAQKDILANTGIALICDPDDMDGSVKLLSNLIDGKINLKPDYKVIGQYSCKTTTERLFKVLGRAAEGLSHDMK